MTNVLSQEDEIAFLQDGEFQGFVERDGAEEIKGSARSKGYKVEDMGHTFNVVYVKGIALDQGDDL